MNKVCEGCLRHRICKNETVDCIPEEVCSVLQQKPVGRWVQIPDVAYVVEDNDKKSEIVKYKVLSCEYDLKGIRQIVLSNEEHPLEILGRSRVNKSVFFTEKDARKFLSLKKD